VTVTQKIPGPTRALVYLEEVLGGLTAVDGWLERFGFRRITEWRPNELDGHNAWLEPIEKG
jgi:hypothetical protein